MIFSDTTSVWSLDLRDGSTRWKVDLEGTWGTLMCVPESDVVSISEYGRADTVVRTSLLAASSGAHLNSATHIRLSAIDPSGAWTLWSLDLDPGQSVDQMGRHLVVIDADDETIHGLKS